MLIEQSFVKNGFVVVRPSVSKRGLTVTKAHSEHETDTSIIKDIGTREKTKYFLEHYFPNKQYADLLEFAKRYPVRNFEEIDKKFYNVYALECGVRRLKIENVKKIIEQ